MTTVVQKLAERGDHPLFLCDFSPPRGADLSTLEQVKRVGADFICVAYSPGKSVRVDSAVVAHLLHQDGSQEVIFNLACRDMNRLALQNHLLGAQLLDLENVLVLRGDSFIERDLALVKDVSDFTPTQLIRTMASLNEGVDYKGLNLRASTSFCIGATIDLGRDDLKREATLAQRKVAAGAHFFITQAFYDIEMANRFLETYQSLADGEFPKPIIYGLQILLKDGLIFGDVPKSTKQELERGRPGTEIALEQLHAYVESGMTNIYLVPPILRGGRRDYEAAQQVMEAFRG